MSAGMIIREAVRDDLAPLLKLYTHLHEDNAEVTGNMIKSWEAILSDTDHHMIVCEADGMIVSSCVCLIVPNLTRGARPYALIENVVTHEDHRRCGYASACLKYAVELANDAGCYKIMLLTGAKDEGILGFYRKAGFNCEDKTAFIRWM